MTLLKTYRANSGIHLKQKRVGVVQRVLTPYRSPFFKELSTKNDDYDIAVFFGEPMNNETIKVLKNPQDFNYYSAKNRYLLNSRNMLLIQTNIIEWLSEFDPDVLVMEANPRILSHWQAIRWMHNRNRPVLGWGLGELERSGSGISQRIRRLIANKLATSFDSIIAYSTKAKVDYIAAGVDPSCVFVAHNSIDNTESEHYLTKLSDCKWIASWRDELGLNPALPIVLFVGRLIASKQIDLLIHACSPLFSHCQLLIVGDGPARYELEQLSAVHSGCVHFAGHQAGEALARSFMASKIFVLPGAGGLALHQAMSYGKPVIASFGDGTEADLIRDGYNGFLFRAGDVDDLTRKIRELLYNREQTCEMGEVSLTIVRTEINLNNMAASFLNAVELTHSRV
jgi:glycosyltransferase involved in cell wall biosynthesis